MGHKIAYPLPTSVQMSMSPPSSTRVSSSYHTNTQPACIHWLSRPLTMSVCYITLRNLCILRSLNLIIMVCVHSLFPLWPCLHSSMVTLPLARATPWPTKRYTGLMVTSGGETRPHGNTCRQDVLFCLDGR